MVLSKKQGENAIRVLEYTHSIYCFSLQLKCLAYSQQNAALTVFKTNA
jgi:hypothetical protein